MAFTFNDKANPKIETKNLSLYADVGAATTPEWELQGRGIANWNFEENADVEKETDVLGMVDMERGTPQRAITGIEMKFRKDHKLGAMIFEAWYSGDYSALNALKILVVYGFVDGSASDGSFLAAQEEDVLIGVNSVSAEAGGYITADIDINFANKRTLGTATIVSGGTVTFTANTAA